MTESFRPGVRRITLLFESEALEPAEPADIAAMVLDDGEIYSSAIIMVRAFAFDGLPGPESRELAAYSKENRQNLSHDKAVEAAMVSPNIDRLWSIHSLKINGREQLALPPVPFVAIAAADELKLETQRPGEQTVLRVCHHYKEPQAFRCTMHAVTPRELDA